MAPPFKACFHDLLSKLGVKDTYTPEHYVSGLSGITFVANNEPLNDERLALAAHLAQSAASALVNYGKCETDWDYKCSICLSQSKISVVLLVTLGLPGSCFEAAGLFE